MHLLTRFIGLNILFVMIWGTMMLGGKTGIYLDIPSVVMVVGVLFGGALLCFPVQQITDAFGAALGAESSAPVDHWQRQQRIAVFARLYQLAWGGGLVGALIGLIAMLSDLSDPASIGAGMAVALLAPAYGALLAEFIFNPMQQMVMNQRPTDGGPDQDGQRSLAQSPVPASGQTALFKGVALIAIMVSMFMTLFVSFSEIKKQDDPAIVLEEIREAYGITSESGDPYDPALSLIERLEDVRTRNGHPQQ
eukprot:g14853.t1